MTYKPYPSLITKELLLLVEQVQLSHPKQVSHDVLRLITKKYTHLESYSTYQMWSALKGKCRLIWYLMRIDLCDDTRMMDGSVQKTFRVDEA